MKLAIASVWDGSPALASEVVHLELGLGDALTIDVDAPWHGDPAPSGPAGVRQALWEWEVVELFLVGAGDRYTEIELGPHGHHLGLRLHGVRQPVETGFPIDWQVRREGDRWRGRARVGLDQLPAEILSFNAYAIHGTDDRRYLAHVPVPGPAPDFHRLECFAPWPVRQRG